MKIKLIKFIILFIAILQNQFNFSMTIFSKGGYIDQIAEYEKSMKIAQTSLQNYVDKKNMEEFRTFQINFKKALDILNLVENSAKKDIANLTPLRAYLASKGFYPGDKPSKIYGAQAKQNAVANLTNNLHFKLEHILTGAGWLATAYFTLLKEYDINAKKILNQIKSLIQFKGYKFYENYESAFDDKFSLHTFVHKNDLKENEKIDLPISIYLPDKYWSYELVEDVNDIKNRLAKALQEKYLYPYDKSEIIFVDAKNNEIEELSLRYRPYTNFMILKKIDAEKKKKIQEVRKQIMEELPNELIPALKKIVAEYII